LGLKAYSKETETFGRDAARPALSFSSPSPTHLLSDNLFATIASMSGLQQAVNRVDKNWPIMGTLTSLIFLGSFGIDPFVAGYCEDRGLSPV